MASKKGWEGYKNIVGDLTKSGVANELWGKRSRNKDLQYECFEQARQQDKKNDDDIAGFSSSDDDVDVNVAGFTCASNLAHQSTAKRAPNMGKTANINKSKRQKKNYEEYNSPLARISQRTSGNNPHAMPNLYTTTPDRTPSPPSSTRASSKTLHLPPNTSRRTNIKARQWKLFSNSFESSFIAESPSHPTQEDVQVEIAWSDSDSEDRKISPKNKSPDILLEEKNPLSTQSVKQQSQGSENINEFDSDNESFTKQLDAKAMSPSISPNTPTPTPTPCTPSKECESHPPLDSSKKGKRKYLRNGLAERLQKLIMQENCNRSFWLHKTQQKNQENDNDSVEGTLIVRVISENLDHGVYVLRCHVLSQNMEPFLPKHVTVLLENDRRKHLDINITYLSINSPWKILHLPESSEPVLMCMAHCEVISLSDFISLDISESSGDEQTPTEVTHSTVDRENYSNIVENKNNEEEEKNETEVEWPLQDSFGYEGVSMTTRVNVTARIQRIYWRSKEIGNHNQNSSSSLTLSIVENAKILNTEKRMSLCCLIQGISNVCCEVMLRGDILLNRTDWHDVLCHSQGTVLTFTRLRLVQHRNRKRAPQLFGLIDSLKTTSSKKQQSCLVFTFDDQSGVEPVSEDKTADYPDYSSVKRLSDLNSATTTGTCRVSFCSKLLYAKFTNDKYYNTKHIRLWLSGNCIAPHCVESVVQVCYSSGRTIEWNESTLLAGQLLSIQDVVFDKVNPAILTADIFSKIQVIVPPSSDFDVSAQDILKIWQRTMTTTGDVCLKSFPVTELPTLNENSRVDGLVTLEGIISGVDYENAYCWYCCFYCSSEDISEITNSISQYHCNTCALEFNSPVTNIHLEVYLKPTSTPNFMVKVKLLQKTIRNLLPESEKTYSGTYDVSSVMNKHLGPMYCHIAEKMQNKNSQISFKLEELDSSSWNTEPKFGLAFLQND